MQNMFIAILSYTRPLEEIDAHLAKHREYLKNLVEKHKLLVAGRLNPRTGTVIISKNISRLDFEKIIKNDPFFTLSEHTILEVTPTIYNESFQDLIKE